MELTDQIKPLITLFLSSSITLPIVNMLIEKNILAGVVVTPRVDADSVNLEQQLQQANIPVVRYDSLNIEQTLLKVKAFGGNLGLVVTFSVKFPKEIIECFEYGMFNVHGSSLPAYRGSYPIFWPLKKQEQESAVVIHKIEEELDCGAIAVSYQFDIHPKDTFGTLSATIFQIVAVVINEFLELFELHNGEIPLTTQKGDVSKAPIPKQSDITIDWSSMGAKEIAALARACNPNFGGAQALWKGAYIGVMEATPVDVPSYGVQPGMITHIGAPEGLLVATKKGTLKIETVYMMDGIFSGQAFADRFSLDAGERFKNTV